jgi:hypothetical protein
MNDARRKIVQAALDKLAEARALLETARDEEQEYFDNMPEAFQSGDKGAVAEGAISSLEEAIGNVESAEGNAEDAV